MAWAVLSPPSMTSVDGTTSRAPLILAATDLSESSDQAILQAHRWAQTRDAPLAVVHVLPDLLPLQKLLQSAGSEARWDAPEKLAERRVREQVERLTGRGPEHAQVLVRHGSPHGVIVSLAEELHASLVVVAASVKASVERLLIGSTAEEVVRHAAVPVLVARDSPDSGLVLAATDLSDMAVAAVEVAVVEASRLHAPLGLLYCLDVDRPLTATFNPFVLVDDATRAAIKEAAHETLKAALAGFDAKGETLVISGDPKRMIAETARELSAQLLVVGTHGTSGPVRFLLGSVALAVARRAHCSVLIARH